MQCTQIEYRALARYYNLSAPHWCVTRPTTLKKKSLNAYIDIYTDVFMYEIYVDRRCKATIYALSHRYEMYMEQLYFKPCYLARFHG